MHIFNTIFKKTVINQGKINEYMEIIDRLAQGDETKMNVVKIFFSDYTSTDPKYLQCDDSVNFCKSASFLEKIIEKFIYARELQLRGNKYLLTEERKKDRFEIPFENRVEPEQEEWTKVTLGGTPSVTRPVVSPPPGVSGKNLFGPPEQSVGGRRQRTRLRRRRQRRSRRS
jgi:hypothetical protein